MKIIGKKKRLRRIANFYFKETIDTQLISSENILSISILSTCDTRLMIEFNLGRAHKRGKKLGKEEKCIKREK